MTTARGGGRNDTLRFEVEWGILWLVGQRRLSEF